MFPLCADVDLSAAGYGPEDVAVVLRQALDAPATAELKISSEAPFNELFRQAAPLAALCQNAERFLRLKALGVEEDRHAWLQLLRRFVLPDIKKTLSSLSSRTLCRLTRALWEQSLAALVTHEDIQMHTALFLQDVQTYQAQALWHADWARLTVAPMTTAAQDASEAPSFAQLLSQCLDSVLPWSALCRQVRHSDAGEPYPLLRKLCVSETRHSTPRQVLRPYRALVLVEGRSEECLLPVLAQQSGWDLSSHGVLVQAVGGKNQMLARLRQWRQTLRLPLMVLLDADAADLRPAIASLLLPEDVLVVLAAGELEDTYPTCWVQKTLARHYETAWEEPPSGVTSVHSSLMQAAAQPTCRARQLAKLWRQQGWPRFDKTLFASHLAETIQAEGLPLSQFWVDTMGQLRQMAHIGASSPPCGNDGGL